MFHFWVDFVQKLMRKDDSANVAAGRLKGSVFLDRLMLSPTTLDQIRGDVIRSISRYLVIDESAMTLAVQAEGRTVALAAQIPVVRQREGGSGGDGFVVHETRTIERAETVVAPVMTRTIEESRAIAPAPPAMTAEAKARARAARRRRQGRRLGMQP